MSSGRLWEPAGARATVVAAEHGMRVTATAEHVIDLGLAGGSGGGGIVAQGTPAQVESALDSRIGTYLKALL